MPCKDAHHCQIHIELPHLHTKRNKVLAVHHDQFIGDTPKDHFTCSPTKEGNHFGIQWIQWDPSISSSIHNIIIHALSNHVPTAAITLYQIFIVQGFQASL
jgi:hypothetical protein